VLLITIGVDGAGNATPWACLATCTPSFVVSRPLEKLLEQVCHACYVTPCMLFASEVSPPTPVIEPAAAARQATMLSLSAGAERCLFWASGREGGTTPPSQFDRVRLQHLASTLIR
jgi:hypothetical protein